MTMTTCNTSSHVKATNWVSSFGLLRLAFAAQAQRRALAKLSQDALTDIGLSADQAKIEANRTFWDVPATWRR